MSVEGTPEVPAEGQQPWMPDMQSLLQQATAMQEQLLQSQQALGDARVTGSAGGGVVTATVSGTGELVSLTIDPSVCDPAEAETLADLVVAAVHDATTGATRLASEQMSAFTAPFADESGPTGKLGF
jgi:DNA-binding YbaB/EbfC family protein